jgi:long-chain acyl-CoA synthetase
MSLGSCLATDELTVLLGLVAASTFLLKNLYKPQPLVHPVLLGRQSDASQVRQAGESAIYRNYGTGMMGRVCPIEIRQSLDVLLNSGIAATPTSERYRGVE